jgi:hypothetical protein
LLMSRCEVDELSVFRCDIDGRRWLAKVNILFLWLFLIGGCVVRFRTEVFSGWLFVGFRGGGVFI